MSGEPPIPPQIDPAIAEMLLTSIAADPNGPLVKVFDEVLYPYVKYIAIKRVAAFSRGSLRRIADKEIFIPGVLPCDVEAVAHDTATCALTKLRASANRFDRSKGEALAWIARAALFAYVDVVRDLYGRRGEHIVPRDPGEMTPPDHESSPQTQVEHSVLVGQAMRVLTLAERDVVTYRFKYGLSYAEMAAMIFGNEDEVKKLEHLLAGAVAKIKSALS